MANGLIHVLGVGKHELWYRVDDAGVVALHKPTGLDPIRHHYSSLDSLKNNLPLIEKEFDRACPGCAEARRSPLLTWEDVSAVHGTETTLDGHRFRVYRERFADGHETITIVHTSNGVVHDFCFENADALEAAWPAIILQVNATCQGCTQLGE
jgi:hypothetical protein